MNFERLLSQSITFWSKSSVDEYNHPAFSSPVTFTGRAQNAKKETIDEMSKLIDSETIIYTDVDNGYNEGDFVYIGETSEIDPLNLDDAFTIGKIYKTYSVDGSQCIYKLILKR